MWELDCEESWAPKNWCFWTVVLEKTLESPLDCKEIQPVHSEGDQSWDFFGRNDAKAETPILWPPLAKSWLIGIDSDAGRDWGQEEKGTTEDKMAGWHHWLDGHESEWTPGVGDGQGGVACWDSWGHKESDMTEQLNWSELNDLGNDLDLIICLLALLYLFSKIVYLDSLLTFDWIFGLLLLSWKHSFYTLNTRPLSIAWPANIFSWSVSCLSTFLTMSFKTKVFNKVYFCCCYSRFWCYI